MSHDASDSQTLQFGHRPGDDHRHEEEVGHAVSMKRFGEKAGSGHLVQLFTYSSGLTVNDLQVSKAAPRDRRPKVRQADI